jgi:thioredoxin reductase (NADPH)
MDSQDSRPLVLVAVTSADARADVVDQLQRRYAADYRIETAARPDDAEAAIRAAEASGAALALLLADAAMSPGEQTVFTAARRRFPDVRRGLVIEWGGWADPDASAAVLNLMARGEIDYYVVRPGAVPDESFHRSMSEFLLDWQRAAGSKRVATVVGTDALPRTHQLRAILARGGVPHGSATPDSEEGASILAAAGVSDRPVVSLADGRLLIDPSNAELVQGLGLTTDVPADRTVDLAIVGAGPAGLAAAVYAASEGLDVVVLERDSVGGQAGSSSLIRNYLGFSRGVSGAELAQRAYQQAWVLGARFAHTREVVGLEIEDGEFRLAVAPDEVLRARSVVLSTGVSYRRLELPGLAPFVGSAVFYGASAVEAKAQTGRISHVVGGGNSAGQAALHLARYAAEVFLIVRSANLAESMSKYLIDELDAAGVTVLTEQRVAGGGAGAFTGDGRLDHLRLQHRRTGEETVVRSDALFITIGAQPHTDWLHPSVLRDKWGFVLTGADVLEEGGRRAWPLDRHPGALESSVPGFFAVGDARRGSLKRVASAVGEGSVVISAVHAFLAEAAAARQHA